MTFLTAAGWSAFGMMAVVWFGCLVYAFIFVFGGWAFAILAVWLFISFGIWMGSDRQ